MSVITVSQLTKVFAVPEREAGLRASVRALVRRRQREVRAVDGISFGIESGEVVGFLGPNGAGKTTTLKLLSGLLYPTDGDARVLGLVPSKRERELLRQITLVMGNRNQLQWDLPALDSFELNRAIYRIPREELLPIRDELIELLDVGRPRPEAGPQPLAGRADEGRDRRLPPSPPARPLPRRAHDRPRRHDAEADPLVRGRVQPALRRDGAPHEPLHGRRRRAVPARDRDPPRPHPLRRHLAALGDRFAAYKTIQVDLTDRAAGLERYGDVLERDGDRVKFRVPKGSTAQVAARLLAEQEVIDLTIEDPPIEDVIELVFAEAAE